MSSINKLSPRKVKNVVRLAQKQKLEAAGWKLVDVAIIAGVTRSAVSHYIAGEIDSSPPIESAIQHLLTREAA